MLCLISRWWQPFMLLSSFQLTALTAEDTSILPVMPEKRCSGICPKETYESRPCSNTEDRECTACSICGGSFYEASPCTPKNNRRCYHAAHPLLLTEHSTIPRFIEEFYKSKPKHKKHKRLKVEASSNIFLEDLQNTRNLETTYYVTDMTQASDFYWDRESELRVNIGILNIHLIPEYHDVSHDGDNKYMMRNPNDSEERSKFQNIVHNSCRNPIPDYYSITLEVSRDRTTAAYTMKCDSKDPSKPLCLPPYKDGETFLYRTLNEPCRKMQTFPKVLQPAANSIVCTDNSALLSEIFNQTSPKERLIRFLSTKCQNANLQCSKCKASHNCKASDIFERKRCLIDCLNLMDCKVALSKECLSVPVECAMGDAYQYTIEPVYHTIKKQFQCHLEHQEVSVLYELFYFLQIPSIGFQTPKVHKTIYAQGLGYQEHGKYKADFITVEHMTGLHLQHDFILSGKEHTGHELSNRFNFSVYPAIISAQNRQIEVHVISITNNIFMVSTQFERPFDYSSSTWVNNNDCNKNISKLKPVYERSSADVQNVSVMVQNLAEPFQYFLKSVNSPPFIRFTVPGNTSILPYYFRDNGPFLYVNQSLSVALELMPAGRVWLIHVFGKMSDCPAYLGVTINDHLETEELFRYDLLIVCPSEFNLTFRIPNWGLQSHKTYEIKFQDPRKTYVVFATHLGTEYHVSVDMHSHDLVEPLPHQPVSVVVFLVVSAITIYLLVMSFIVHICVNKRHSGFHRESASAVLLCNAADQTLTGRKLHRLASRQICLTTTYVVARVAYSVCTSVTLFCLGIIFLTKNELAVMVKVPHFHSLQTDMLANFSAEFEKDILVETVRIQRLVNERQTSCSSYVGDLIFVISRIMETTVSDNHFEHMYSKEHSISCLVVNQTLEQFLHYRSAVDNFLASYKAKLNNVLFPVYTSYRKYLRRVHENEWLAYAQELYNTTRLSLPLPRLEHNNLNGPEVDFSIFLEIEEVEEFQLWMTQFWERFYFQYPSLLPTFLNMNLTKVSVHCDANIIPNSTVQGQLQHYDSTRFFGSLSSGDFHEMTWMLTNDQRPVTSLPHKMQPLFRDDDSVEIRCSVFLWVTCVILDLLLLSHHTCHTYCYAKAIYGHLRCPVPRDRLVCKKKTLLPGNGQCLSTNHLTCEKGNYQLNQQFLPSSETNNQNSIKRYNNSGAIDQESIHDDKQSFDNSRRCQTVHHTLSAAVRSRLVPRVVVMSTLMVFLYFLLQVCIAFYDTEVLIHANVLGAFVSPIVTQANLSSLFAAEQTNDINNQMRTYETQMNSELVSLSNLLLLFNIEQKQLIDNYIRESCAFHQIDVLMNRSSCDIKVPLENLEIPMLPCNFLPIEPQPHTEFAASKYEKQMAVVLRQFISSLTNIIVTVLHCLFILVAILVIIHVIGGTLFHCLQLRSDTVKHWRTQPSYIQRDYIDHPFISVTNSNEPFEQEDFTRKPHAARASAATLVTASPTRVTAMLFDFGYSETKV